MKKNLFEDNLLCCSIIQIFRVMKNKLCCCTVNLVKQCTKHSITGVLVSLRGSSSLGQNESAL